MKRFTFAIALAAALAASPALAAENEPVRGSQQDPFSQTYDGLEARPSPATGDHAAKPVPRDCSCAQGQPAGAAIDDEA